MSSLSQGRRSAPATKTSDSEPGPNALIAAGQRAQVSTDRSNATFMHLPAEIHLLISKELTYPDALSLKHTSRYLYGLVDTGVRLKVAWLMQRRMLHLDCPNDRKCNLRTDLEFCRGSVTLVSSLVIITIQRLAPRLLTCHSASSCRDAGSTLSVSRDLASGAWSMTRRSVRIEGTGGRLGAAG